MWTCERGCGHKCPTLQAAGGHRCICVASASLCIWCLQCRRRWKGSPSGDPVIWFISTLTFPHPIAPKPHGAQGPPGSPVLTAPTAYLLLLSASFPAFCQEASAPHM